MTILSQVFIIHFLPPLALVAFHLPAKAGTLSAGFFNSTKKTQDPMRLFI
jgi:hypothetical protein